MRRQAKQTGSSITKFTLRVGCVLTCLLLFGGRAYGLSGTVVQVVDGDTLRVKSNSGKSVIVRLAGIDAPERQQAFGSAAAKRLRGLCLNRAIVGEARKTDRYGRLVARVTCAGVDPSRKLLDEGYAWFHARAGHEQEDKERLGDEMAEASARVFRRGLWSGRDPLEPWEYRRRRERGAK